LKREALVFDLVGELLGKYEGRKIKLKSNLVEVQVKENANQLVFMPLRHL
jgi:hypothetical protein